MKTLKLKLLNALHWLWNHPFVPVLLGLVGVYLRWFRITPFIRGGSPGGFVVGVVLLLFFGLSVRWCPLSDRSLPDRVAIALPSAALLIVNLLYLNSHMPQLVRSGVCNGATVYITYAKILGDEQWTYDQVSIWDGVFGLTTFVNYISSGPSKIVCDEAQGEINFIAPYLQSLHYTYGAQSRAYDKYAVARLGKKRYFLSARWTRPEGCTAETSWKCAIQMYQLYECDLSYTACHPLPVTYTGSDIDDLYLRVDKKANQIVLVEQRTHPPAVSCNGGRGVRESTPMFPCGQEEDREEETLIFSYGETTSRCFVPGCLIGEK